MCRTIIAFLFAILTLRADGSDDVVSRAMRDEMQREMKKLQLESEARPYFISYRVIDNSGQSVSAEFGSLLHSNHYQTRWLSVTVRVGDYSLDNSNFLSIPFGSQGVATRMFNGSVELPLDNNYDEIRRQLWIATDGVYKKALQDLSGKRAALENKNRTDNTPDFTKGSPVKDVDEHAPVSLDMPEAENLVRRLSALFRELPAIQTSSVSLSAENLHERFITSEGADLTHSYTIVNLHANAETQADDGTGMSDSYRLFCRSLKDLPDEASLKQNIRAVADRLLQRRTAKPLEQYNGPVLFEGQAAAELFARHFVSSLPAEPGMLSDNPQFMQAVRNQTPASPLLNRIGARVMPDFVSVTDNPSLTAEDAIPLMGNYKIDEEGTPGRETVVVQNGILKTLLVSRVPIKGVPQSTGNFRGRGPAPSNVLLTASKSVSPEDLKKQLLEMVKSRGLEYGVVVRNFVNNSLVFAFRVYPDGREELIRKGTLSGFGVGAFKELAAVSNRRTVYTEPFARQASPFNFVPVQMQTLVSYVVPDLLFEDLTLEGPREAASKPPILPRPN